MESDVMFNFRAHRIATLFSPPRPVLCWGGAVQTPQTRVLIYQ